MTKFKSRTLRAIFLKNVKYLFKYFLQTSKISIVLQKIILIIFLLVGYSSLAQLSNTTRNYSERNAINLVGNFDVIGNTNIQCSGCGAGTQTNNPPANMVYVDIDGDATTQNSSSSLFTLPLGATVEWAGLYWGGVYSSTFGGITNPVGLNNDQVRLKQPGAVGYTTINAISRNLETTFSPGWNTFMAFAEITPIVQSAGSGNYSVADINLATGNSFTGSHGGWTMVVIYSDPSDLSRRINVWDGFRFFGFGTSDSFTVTGVLTPTLGAFETKIAYFGMDGEASSVGDFININGNALSNTLNPANNIYNGTISVFGINSPNRNPNITGYNWGYDLDVFNAAGFVPNSATSIGVQLGSTNEGIWGGVFVISNEIVLPTLSKSFSDVRINRIGDTSTITLTIDNPNRGISMTNTSVTDNLPSGLVIAPVPNALISCGGTISAVPGSNTFVASGMNIPVNSSCTITFDIVATQLGIFRNRIDDSNFSNTQGVDLQNVATAILKVGEDTDGDGIIDILDLDDDNDGITDTQELCGTEPLPVALGTATILINIDLDQDENETSWTLVNPLSLSIGSGGTYTDGDEFISQGFTIATSGNYTFNILDTFGDGMARTGGSNSNGLANYSITVDGNNIFTSTNNPNFGSVSSHSFSISIPSGNAFSCLTSDPNNDDDGDGLFNYQDVDYATANGLTLNANGVISSLDVDSDGIINSLDLDSDNDGIYDIVESGAISVVGVTDIDTDGRIDGSNLSATVGVNGVFDLIETVAESGSLNYTVKDSDGDSIFDIFELDADDDNCNDVDEAGYTDDNNDGLLGSSPEVIDANGLVTSGSDGYTTPLDGNSNSVFDFQEVGSANSISTQPISKIICVGDNGSFSVNATGSNLTYQWQLSIDDGLNFNDLSDGGFYSGTNTATLNIANANETLNKYQYRVIISNSAYICGIVSSSAAILTVPDVSYTIFGIDPATCDGNNGFIIFNDLASSTIYSIIYIDDGTVIGPSNFTSNASGQIVISGLNAGTYTGVVASLTGCSGPSLTQVLNNPVNPAAPSSGGNQTECEQNPTQTLIATATPPIGSRVVWYNSLSGGSVVANPILSNVGIVTYFAESIDNITGCPSLTRTAVSLTIEACTSDLSLRKTVDNSSPNQGDTITFTITISNAGPSGPTNIVVKDIISTDFTYTHPNFSTTQGVVTFNTGTREFEWDLGAFVLGVGNTVTLTYTVTVAVCGEFRNRAEIINSSLTDSDSTPNNGG